MSKMMKSIMMRGMVILHYGLMVGLFFVCWDKFYRIPANQGAFGTHNIAICTVYASLFFLLGRNYGIYKVGLFRTGEIVYSQLIANLVSLGMTYVLACILAIRVLNPLAGVCLAIVQVGLCSIWTLAANKLYFALHKPKGAVIIYRDEQDLQKLEEVQFFTKRWAVEKRVRLGETNSHDLPQDGKSINAASNQGIYELIEIMQDYDVVFVSGVNATFRNGIVKYCIEADKECYFVPHTGDVITAGATHIRSFAVPICRARRSNCSPEFLFIKRAFDIMVSLCAIVLLSPFMLITALAIKSYDHGPVLYKQVRLTKDGKRFEILKFRSMKTDAEKDGVARLASDKDDRITPVGRIIRAIRFDELPQLFNIFQGDMSIVGPRPERPEIAEQYMKELPAFNLRLQVKAGLTGYAQVYGRYNTEPQDKLKMDLMYINNIGLIEDLKLIFATVRILFMRESTQGVEEGQETAAKSVEKSA